MKRRPRGFTLLELVIVVAIVAILGTMLMPKVYSALTNARESAALQHLKAIHAAQAMHMSRTGAFAPTLEALHAAKLIPEDLAQGARSGYRFVARLTEEGYSLTAIPTAANSGDRSFYSDETLVTRQGTAKEPATAVSPVAN